MRAVDHIDPPRIGITSRCPSVVRLSLRCGISIRSISLVGHKRRRWSGGCGVPCPPYPRKRTSTDVTACPLGPLSRRKWSLQSQRARHNCDTRPDGKISYNRGMNENLSRELLAWLTQAGLAGTPESDIFSVFCDRCVAAGVPLGRAHVAIDTLHPVHEGSLFRWGYPNEPLVYEYGRTRADSSRIHS